MKKEEEEKGANERRQYDRSQMKRKQNKTKRKHKRDREERKGNVIEGGKISSRGGGIKNKIRKASKGRG